MDGDTIEVRLRGRVLDVRLIGVDTPETVHPSEPVGCYGPAASAFTSRMLSGKRVKLEYDVERTDRYGRTLAYIWLDGLMFNRTLVASGFAQVSTYPPNVKYVERFVAAQRDARRRGAGLWSRCPSNGAAGSGSATAGGTSGGATSGGAASGGGTASGGSCDPNYSGACIPSYPPDLDCGEVGATDFRSTGSDPHGFDADADGVGCES